MKPARMKRWTPVAVTWVDAATSIGNENAQAFIDGFKPTIRRTIGWFLARSNGHIFVCMEDDRQKERSGADGITTIPVGIVQKIEVLEIKTVSALASSEVSDATA